MENGTDNFPLFYEKRTQILCIYRFPSSAIRLPASGNPPLKPILDFSSHDNTTTSFKIKDDDEGELGQL